MPSVQIQPASVKIEAADAKSVAQAGEDREFARDPAYRPVSIVPKTVCDRIPPVAAEILAADFYARRGLAAFVFGDVDEVFDAPDRCRVVAAFQDVVDIFF